MDVPPERQFVGLDGYKKAIDSLDKGDVVLLATAPAFRPIHLEYAVQKGRQRLHGEVVRRGRPGHPPRAQGRRGGHEEEPQDRRRPDEPALQAAGGSGRADPRRPDRRRDHRLGLPHARPGRAGRQGSRARRSWPTRSPTTAASPGSTAASSWTGSSTTSTSAAGSKDAWPVSVQGMGGRQVAQGSATSSSTITRPNTRSPTARGCSPRAGT